MGLTLLIRPPEAAIISVGLQTPENDKSDAKIEKALKRRDSVHCDVCNQKAVE